MITMINVEEKDFHIGRLKMLNKELLMLETELPPVHVTLGFYGGRNSGTDYM